MKNQTANTRVGFVQDGARRRYIVPKALHMTGRFEAMYTDWFVAKNSWQDRVTSSLPLKIKSKLRNLLDRRCDDIPAQKVIQSFLLTYKLRNARKRFASSEAFFAWEAEEKGRWILDHLRPSIDLWMGFVRNIPPNLCEYAMTNNIPVIADQIIAPAAVEQQLLEVEADRWPDWNTTNAKDQSITIALEERTWKSLTRVTCMSPFVKDGLIECGVSEDRIDVIPYPFDIARWEMPVRSDKSGPITIGFTGSINLRKGIPYLFQVAQLLKSKNVKFVLIGQSTLSKSILDKLPVEVEMVGRLPRNEVIDKLRVFDIFYFPSTCEGSAGSVVEAMAMGLPVVTTYQSGSVIRDGIDGFIVKYDDIETTACRLDQLITDSKLRRNMGLQARKRLEEFDLNWYADTLARLVDDTVAKK